MNYIQEKAEVYNQIKERGLKERVPNYGKATLDELRQVLGAAGGVDDGDVSVTVTRVVVNTCAADCQPEAARHLRAESGRSESGVWTLRPFGHKEIKRFQRGPEVKFCPFCGRRLKADG